MTASNARARKRLAVPELLHRVGAALEVEADPGRAKSAAAYMRNQFVFYGIPAPAQKAIWREAEAGLPKPTERELKRVALEAWKRPQREWQYFACGYLRKHVGVASEKFIDVARKLVTTRSWWDTVDSLAARTVGPLVQRHPKLTRVMDDWIRSEDIWLARTAILHQLTYRDATDPKRLFAYCERRAADREFFIRKAIGWSLREYSKTDARSVRRFVREHRDELSPLSRSEALKWLERRR